MKKAPLSCEDKDDGSATIFSGNRLTIETAAEFSTLLREALTKSDPVAVSLNPEAALDVTAIQILCSGCKTAAAQGKRLHGQGLDSDDYKQLIAASGATHRGICKYNNGAPCAWFGGNA